MEKQEQIKRRRRERYLGRVQNHQCARCGKTDDRTLEGYAYCEICRVKHLEYNHTHEKSERKPYNGEQQRWWRKLQKKNHFCISCYKQDAYTLSGRTYCAECAARNAEKRRARRDDEKNRLSAKEARDKWRSEGRCTRCGAQKWDDGYRTCPECRAYSIRRKAEKRTCNYPRGENGICFLCNRRPVIEGKRLCVTCYERAVKRLEVARTHIDNENHAWRKTWK